MGYFKIIYKDEEPNRLFIGGVHGKEGQSTIHALEQLSEDDVSKGRLVIYNCDNSDYMSTLKSEYYESKVGKEILYLINYYQPQIYIELHCYKKENYFKLINPNRRSEQGVPPLIELDERVLIGSVSPYIRTTLFKRDNICMTVEMPCEFAYESLKIYVDVLKIIASSNSREEMEGNLEKIYPEQVEIARKYAKEFFGDYPPF